MNLSVNDHVQYPLAAGLFGNASQERGGLVDDRLGVAVDAIDQGGELVTRGGLDDELGLRRGANEFRIRDYLRERRPIGGDDRRGRAGRRQEWTSIVLARHEQLQPA